MKLSLWQARTPLLATIALAGCAGPRPLATPGPLKPIADISPHPVSSAESRLGKVEVVDRRGLRLLKVGGVVQDAVRIDPLGGGALVPHTARLLRAVRPAARRVLVIGLGTGMTSSRLMASGYRVTTVAHAPELVAAARAGFGFRGPVVLARTVEQIPAPEPRYDAVIWNTLARPEPKLVTGEAIDSVHNGLLAPGGLLVLRLKASTRNPEVARVAERLGQRFTQIYGSGLGDERQNLYVLHSTEAINVAKASLAGLWPVTLPGDRGQDADDERRTSRTSTLLVGYLTRERSTGALCLDLPRWQKGAVRYLLVGPKSRALARAVPRRGAFPSYQQLLEARRRVTTAHPVLGGGGAPRSDLRLSSVVAAVRGDARVASVVHWDAASDTPGKKAPGDHRLPYGGALYELKVTQVVGVYGPGKWRQLLGRLEAVARRAAAAISRGNLKAAAAALNEGLAQINRAFGPVIGPRTQVQVEVARMHAALLAEVRRHEKLNTRLEPRPLPGLFAVLERGRACDRALDRSGHAYDRASPQVARIAVALGRCAEAAYERLAQSDKASGRAWAASRLAQLWQQRLPWLAEAEASRLRQRLDALRARYPGRLREVGVPE